MPGAADNLKAQQSEQQKEHEARKMAEDAVVIAQKNKEKYELEVAQMAIAKGFGTTDPIGDFHKAVDAFDEEKAQWIIAFNADKVKSNNAVNQHNANVKLFIEDRQKFNTEVLEHQNKVKSLEDSLVAYDKQILDKQTAIQNLDDALKHKNLDLEDVKQRLSLCIKTYQKLLAQIQDRRDFHYNLALSDKLGRLLEWCRGVFKGE